jgi:hypothetical protein
MGYACPVCETPHPDGEHLANHLAFTALLGREDHEAWLAEHAPDWESMDPGELAAVVTDAVPETEFPQVFDDTTDGHDHDHGQSFDPDDQGEAPGAAFARQPATRGDGSLDEEAAEVVEEARRMTEQMLDRGDAEGATDGDDGDDQRAADGDDGGGDGDGDRPRDADA